MPITGSTRRVSWADRIDRAEELAERNSSAKQVLEFYCHVLHFQRSVYEETQMDGRRSMAKPGNIRALLDFSQAARALPALVKLVAANGPPVLARFAGQFQGSSPQQVCDLLARWLEEPDQAETANSFFARVLLQPQAERLAGFMEASHPGVAGNLCSLCKSPPQLAIIRPEGDGGKRNLLCSLCQSEWEFRRILCPACGEVNHEKLPRYSAEGVLAVRVEACDTCRQYLKSVDLTVDGLAVPVVDEIATAPLDLWAAEHNYRKIQVNLMGF